jgi:hypothetical protein
VDPDPASQNDADADPDLASKNDADSDPDLHHWKLNSIVNDDIFLLFNCLFLLCTIFSGRYLGQSIVFGL